MKRYLDVIRIACLIFVVSLGVCSGTANGQALENKVIEGVVVDSSSGIGIIGANVFVEGTTIGTSSDKNGNFGFQIPSRINEFTLIISYVGYQTEKLLISNILNDIEENVFYRVELKEKTVELDAIVINASNKEWRRNLERFKVLAFSSTQNSSQCKIEQPENLFFDFDGETNNLVATSREPFVFENKALGYVISIHDFSLEGSASGYKWRGSLQFQPLESSKSSDLEKWEMNRFKLFHGSSKHFISSVVAGTALKEGFSVALVYRPGLRFEERDVLSENDAVTVTKIDSTYSSLHFPNVLAVYYSRSAEAKSYADYQASHPENGLKGRFRSTPGQVSWLTLQEDFLVVDSYGNEYGNYAAIRYGAWEFERLCDVLPTDFELR